MHMLTNADQQQIATYARFFKDLMACPAYHGFTREINKIDQRVAKIRLLSTILFLTIKYYFFL